jgi:hypothetical protein
MSQNTVSAAPTQRKETSLFSGRTMDSQGSQKGNTALRLANLEKDQLKQEVGSLKDINQTHKRNNEIIKGMAMEVTTKVG